MIWVVFITVLFMLPTASTRSTSTNFNYTVFAVVAVIGFAGIYWLVSARNWFTGPKVQGIAEELAAIEAELDALVRRLEKSEPRSARASSSGCRRSTPSSSP